MHSSCSVTQLSSTLQSSYETAQQLLQNGHYQAARDTLEDVLPEAQDHLFAPHLWRTLLKTCIYLRDFKGALRYGREALQAAQTLQDRCLEATFHNEIAVVYGRLGLYSQALEHLLLSLSGNPNAPDLWSPLNNIGQLYMEQGRFQEAQRSFRQAFESAHAQKELRALGIITGNLGRVHRALGDDDTARQYFKASIGHFEMLGDATYLAPAFTRLANLLADQGEIAAALELLHQSLELHQDAGAFVEETLLTLGRIYLQHQLPDRAEAPLLQARGLAENAELLSEAAEANRLLSALYEARGAYPEALACLKRHQQQHEQVMAQTAAERLQALMVQHEVTLLEQERDFANVQREALAAANHELMQLNTELERLSQEDGLTGLYNRRYLNSALIHEVGKAARYQSPLSLILCDIDYFKIVNDTFSHAIGDEVLRQVARLLQTHTRMTDVVARYGGEEFALLLPNTSLSQAHAIAEKLRCLIANHNWQAVAPALTITLSCGVATLEPAGTSESLLIAADRALYLAKAAGRNTVCY